MFDITEDPKSPILAKGRGGGSSSGSGISIDTSWDAPPIVKAIFAVQIIWFIFLLIESLLILRGLKLISKTPRSSKAPYLLAAFVAAEVSIYYLVGAIRTRLGTEIDFIINYPLRYRYTSAISFLFDIDLSFRPIVLLWLCHLRGVLSTIGSDIKGNKNSFVASTWKKVVDWSLFVILFAISFAYSSMITVFNNASYNHTLSMVQAINLNDAIKRIIRAREAFTVILAINIVVSLVCLKVAQQRARIADKVITRLLVISVPFVIVEAAETIGAEIFSSTQYPYNRNKFALALNIIEGICRVMILAGIIATMKVASTPQNALDNEESTGNTGGYPANSQHPFYPAPPPYQTSPMTTPPQQQGWDAPPMTQQGYPYQVPYNHPTNQSWQR
ncbi:hypothetical protein FRB91_011267 [Serendipita sp. 411]|nr:hypothetical protein FRB91_011267 [Serendipita sp. 411]